MTNKNVDYQNTNGDNWLANFFLIQPFTLEQKSYFSYRFWLFLGIITNSVVTLVFEKWFIIRLTKIFDDRNEKRKNERFLLKMVSFEH
jgi:hypothetical protein